MLIKRHGPTPIVSSSAASVPLGPLPRRQQRLIDTSASFAGVYLLCVPTTTRPAGGCRCST